MRLQRTKTENKLKHYHVTHTTHTRARAHTHTHTYMLNIDRYKDSDNVHYCGPGIMTRLIYLGQHVFVGLLIINIVLTAMLTAAFHNTIVDISHKILNSGRIRKDKQSAEMVRR